MVGLSGNDLGMALQGKTFACRRALYIPIAKAWGFRARLITIDRSFPFRKRCGCFGHILPNRTLTVRTWTGSKCGKTPDRDIQSMLRSTLAAGPAVLVCGKAVRPERKRSWRPGKPRPSRKAPS